MGEPNTSITFGIPAASGDGRYYSRYPDGTAFAASASGALVAAVAAALAGTAAEISASGVYSYIDDLAADYYVDPARITDGVGDEASPFQPSQAFALDPAGAGAVLEWLPGDLEFSDAHPSGGKFPRWYPQFSGTEANPIIHRCRYKANRSATTESQLTRIVRTGGIGSLLGISGSISDVFFDGFCIPTWTGNHLGTENYQFSIWGGTRIKFLRFLIDGEGEGQLPPDVVQSSNGGGIWCQPATDCEIADGIVRNVGSFLGADIWSGFECYDTQGLNLHHVTFENIHGFGVFMKGDATREFVRNRIHHCSVRNVSASCYFAYQVEAGSTPLSELNWWYHNIGIDAGQHGIQLSRASTTPHSGTIFQNNTLVRCAEGLTIRGGATYAPLVKFVNNVYYNCTRNIVIVDGGGWNSNVDSIEVDYSRYYGNTGAHYNGPDGNRTFAQWKTLTGNGVLQDIHGDQNVPLMVNPGAGDFRTDDIALADGLDFLGIDTGGAIRRGAFGEIGCRDDA